MTRALVRAGLRSRLMLIAVIIFVCCFMRLAHLVGEDDGRWSLGEMHAVATIVVLGLVLPTFTLLLGSMLLRGEHGPWSWALARPVSRWRVLPVLIVLDISTLGACVATMALLFDGLGYVSHVAHEREIIHAALPVVYALLYLAAAIGGARGMGSLRAGLFALVWLAALAGLAHVVLLNLDWLDGPFRHFRDPTSIDEAELLTVLLATVVPIPLLAAVVVLVGVVIPFVRSSISVPAMPRWGTLLTPPLVAFAISTVVAAGLACGARAWIASHYESRVEQ